MHNAGWPHVWLCPTFLVNLEVCGLRHGSVYSSSKQTPTKQVFVCRSSCYMLVTHVTLALDACHHARRAQLSTPALKMNAMF